jgi:hypothetical protein
MNEILRNIDKNKVGLVMDFALSFFMPLIFMYITYFLVGKHFVNKTSGIG